MPQSHTVAEAVVRHAMETAVSENDQREILATAFNVEGETLPDKFYGGMVSYRPSDGKIVTLADEAEREYTESDKGEYYVRLEECRTATGITPLRQWFNVEIVFPVTPATTAVKTAVLQEIDKLKPKELDITVYIFTGDKSNKISWKQIKAPNDHYMVVEYDSATKRVVPKWDWD